MEDVNKPEELSAAEIGVASFICGSVWTLIIMCAGALLWHVIGG